MRLPRRRRHPRRWRRADAGGPVGERPGSRLRRYALVPPVVAAWPPRPPAPNPPNPPNPLVHLPLTGSVTAILVAATVPVESALPSAVTQRPTVAAAAVADRTVVILVAEVRVTVLFVVVPALAVGLALAAGVAPAPGPKLREATTMVEPETDTTEPTAKAPVLAAPDGRAKLRVPDGRGRARALDRADGKAPPPNPPKQRPFTAVLTVTAVAVNEAAVSEPAADEAVTQSPALIEPRLRVTCWVNFVAAVQVTATCPT